MRALRICRAAMVAVIASAGAGKADAPLLAFFERHGCTIGPESRSAAIAAGFSAAAVDDLMQASRAELTGVVQGDWLVLDPSICTIRLPELSSAFSADSPEIRTVAPYIREVYDIGAGEVVEEGCFLNDPVSRFTALADGDAEAGFAEYIAFLGAGIISGDVRFYAPTPLATPRAFQLTRGDCARAPAMGAIERSHAIVGSGFGAYIRFLSENALCGGDHPHLEASAFAIELQGADPDQDPAGQEPVNAWASFEFDIITMAAGWHAGQTATERGTPRPPLCHYE